MAGLFGILDVASRGMAVNQRGIQTAGHNIANAETPGYSRQRQVLAASAPLQNPNGHLGTGVEQLTIERASDAFVQAQLVKQGSQLASTEAQANALGLVQEVFNEQDAEGLSAVLSRLYDAFSDLASSQTPGAPVEREAVRAAATAAIDTLHARDTQLRDLQRSTDDSIVALLPEINDLSQRIQSLNEEIARLEVTAPANDLRDQRDQLVRDLADRADIATYEDARGRVVVTLGNGLPLVEGGFARSLVAVADPTNPFDPTYSQVRYRDGANDLDVTADLGGGRLGGLLRARDTVIAGAIRSLDTIAYNVAETVNGVHNLGTGLNGTTGDFFASLPAVEDAARDLQLDANILASADSIAAGLTTAPGDNTNALALASLRDATAPIFLPGDPPGPASGPTRSLLEHVAAVTSDVGQQTRTMELSRQQQGRVLEGLHDRRDEVSGVSIDEEVTNLIRLQAAFQANSRVVSVVDRLLQDVLELI